MIKIWNDGSTVQDSLIPAIKADPSTDGGYPSGHTNAAYLASLGLAYAVPERYDELLVRASELGNNRIICGMHSCLDVIGGRVMASAVAAALNDPNNETVKKSALETSKILLNKNVTGSDDFSNYEDNKKKYIERLTYGFEQTGDTTQPMKVPKGAEVLLESRLPYLDKTQRRYVLYTTGLPSGYPVLDDEEGWGRLNLFEASNGYGSFLTDVAVNMDSSKGGFNASDNWRNDIDGTGSLTKEGSGSLTLSGNNSYTGSTIINQGNINADLNEKLVLNFNDGYIPENNLEVISYSSTGPSKFDSITINGLNDKEAVYTDKGIIISNIDKIAEKPAPDNPNDNISESNKNNEPITNDNVVKQANTYSNTAKTGDNSVFILLIAAMMLCIIKKSSKLKQLN